MSRYRVVKEESAPHGGPFELEIDTLYRVVDTATGETVLRFEQEYTASWSTDGSGWGEGASGGVTNVEITPDGRFARVHLPGGRYEDVPLPG